MDSLHPQNYILFTFHRLVAELYQYQKKYRESLPYLQLMAKSTEVSLPLYHPQKAVYYEAVLDACIALHMQEPASLEEMAPIWRPATEYSPLLLYVLLYVTLIASFRRTLDIFSVTHGKVHPLSFLSPYAPCVCLSRSSHSVFFLVFLLQSTREGSRQLPAGVDQEVRTGAPADRDQAAVNVNVLSPRLY